ncbi:hypothetical protein [uncultured Parvimonas sp.]|uniref:hypothetical protein n=1 Tax=uncultured Parvimonas sp. TaxID=747372 RepID=UPI00259A5BD3|nr:hypothetical protein [uncultured Parvimonas sp.]
MVDIKQELKNIKYLDFKIKSEIKELEKLKIYEDILKGIDYRMDKVQNSNKSDISDTIVKIVDLEENIKKNISILVEKKNELKSKITILEPTMCKIMYLRYFEYLSWYEISSQIYYSEGYIKKLHGIALEILRKNVTKDY